MRVCRRNWRHSIVTDITDSLPSLLASLPGTLQTMINTSIALAKARAGNDQTAAGPGQPGGPMSGPPNGRPGPQPRVPRAARRPSPAGDPAASNLGGRGGPSRPGARLRRRAAVSAIPREARPRPPSTTGFDHSGTANDSMVVLKIDSDKLPKAADLKAYLFPSSLSSPYRIRTSRSISRRLFPICQCRRAMWHR